MCGPFFSGEVGGPRMNPDGIVFDREGSLYVSDSRGLSEGKAHGRVVRIGLEGGGLLFWPGMWLR